MWNREQTAGKERGNCKTRSNPLERNYRVSEPRANRSKETRKFQNKGQPARKELEHFRGRSKPLEKAVKNFKRRSKLLEKRLEKIERNERN